MSRCPTVVGLQVIETTSIVRLLAQFAFSASFSKTGFDNQVEYL